MNLYCVVEGERTEKLVYRAWLKHLFPKLDEVFRPEDVRENSLRLVVGYGYPSYLDVIDQVFAEIRDIVRNRVDQVFVCVDAEEVGYGRRLAEIEHRIRESAPVVGWTVVIQDCCLETWLLGNRPFVKANPQKDPRAIEYRGLYDVRRADPEKMPNLEPDHFGTRAQFHEDYLRAVFRERNERYSKKRPGRACDSRYLTALTERIETTGHLASFRNLMNACRALGTSFPPFVSQDGRDGFGSPTDFDPDSRS